MRKSITRALSAAAVVGVALSTAGVGSVGASATAARQSLSPPVYTTGQAGYTSYGRWFRFVSTTLTIPPLGPASEDHGGQMLMVLHTTARIDSLRAVILVRPGGGAGSIGWSRGQTLTPFKISPRVGDRLAVSIYYDRHGHDYFTATDLSQGLTRQARVTVGNVTYNKVSLWDNVTLDVTPPANDIRQWQLASTRLTTYSGKHGTVTGAWKTSQMIETSTGTSKGTVIASPSGLGSGGASFSVWLRAIPLDFNNAFAGYSAGGGPFRFVATTLTVPPVPAASGNNNLAYIELFHAGGPTPRPYGYIQVQPGGGSGSVAYDCLYLPRMKTLAISPDPGDRLWISVFYDQHGHLQFTAADLTQGVTATASEPAQAVSSAPYNMAGLRVYIDNGEVSPPPADIQLWAFTTSRITTYAGEHGSVLGPWGNAEEIDTSTGTSRGAIVMEASLLSNAGQDFGVWLHH